MLHIDNKNIKRIFMNGGSIQQEWFRLMWFSFFTIFFLISPIKSFLFVFPFPEFLFV